MLCTNNIFERYFSLLPNTDNKFFIWNALLIHVYAIYDVQHSAAVMNDRSLLPRATP